MLATSAARVSRNERLNTTYSIATFDFGGGTPVPENERLWLEGSYDQPFAASLGISNTAPVTGVTVTFTVPRSSASSTVTLGNSKRRVMPPMLEAMVASSGPKSLAQIDCTRPAVPVATAA